MTDLPRRARGDGTVYYDPELRRWIAQASVGRDDTTGKRRRLKRTGATKGEASRRLKEAMADWTGGRKPASGPRTVADLLERWLEAGAPSRERNRKTPAAHRQAAGFTRNHLVPALGHHRIGELRPEHVEAMLAARSHLTKKTLSRMRGFLSQAYDWAIARRYASWNPVQVSMLPEVTKPASTRRALTVEEVDLLLAEVAGHRREPWVVLALATGARPGEISSLRWEDVDLEHGSVLIHATKTKTVRTVGLPTEVVEVLRAHRLRQVEERLEAGDRWPSEHDGLVFRTEIGTPFGEKVTRSFIIRLAARAGIEGRVNPYDLRHTTTTRLSGVGVAPELLADLLGHKDTTMVFKHYRHPVTPVIMVAADHFTEAFDR